MAALSQSASPRLSFSRPGRQRGGGQDSTTARTLATLWTQRPKEMLEDTSMLVPCAVCACVCVGEREMGFKFSFFSPSSVIQHSCGPNMFVQNVFIDTHDLRFPWVAFFAKK